jgi:DNA-directed RNA polymerase subunit beta'
MTTNTKTKSTDIDPDELKVGGPAFEEMLSHINLKNQFNGVKNEILETKSPSKRDTLIKKIKYLDGLIKSDLKPTDAFIIRHIPVVPPLVRPTLVMGNNSIEYADANNLYKDHMLVNESFKGIKDFAPNNQLINERKALYEGAKAVFGLGDAITGASRGKSLKGFVRQISGTSGPKQGYFHSKLLSKKLDFSGRGTIYAEPNLGFNEAAIPEDMIWVTYEFHIIRDLVKQGFDYVSAKKSVEARSPAAKASFSKLIKQIPVLLNRAPTLMRTNITAHYPIPIKGKTIGINPLHLPLYAGDYDGDALTLQVPMTPEAIEEARTKLLPEHHIHDYRKGLNNSMVAPGHEAIIGSVHMTEPDMSQEPKHFKTELEALRALKAGTIKENTPITIG